MRGLLFDIKRYAIHDGPGIRVTFFMKGCPLRCWWCHNPEGISGKIEEVTRVDRIGEKEFSVNEKVGRYWDADELVAIAEKERVFIEESKGGVTFSGGEPMMQPDFLEFVLKTMKKAGFHTTVDTSGLSSKNNLARIMEYTDLFLYDLKHLDNEKHINYTGVSNKEILSNLDFLIDEGKEVIIRYPLVPGINDDKEHLGRVKDLLMGFKKKGVREINLLPYHKTGGSKYKRFGMENRMGDRDEPTKERMKELSEYLSLPGLKIKVGG